MTTEIDAGVGKAVDAEMFKGHTPGPWKPSEFNPLDIVADDAAGTYVAEVLNSDGPPTPTALANAAIIAAAPHLLAELQRLKQVNARLLSALRVARGAFNDHNNDRPSHRCTWDFAGSLDIVDAHIASATNQPETAS